MTISSRRNRRESSREKDQLGLPGFDFDSNEDVVPCGADADSLDVIVQNSFPSPNYENEGSVDQVVSIMDPYLSPRSEETMDIGSLDTLSHPSLSDTSDGEDNVAGMTTVTFDDLLDDNFGVSQLLGSDRNVTSPDPDEDDIDKELQRFLAQESENPAVDTGFVEKLLAPDNDDVDIENVASPNDTIVSKDEPEASNKFTNIVSNTKVSIRPARNTIVIRGGTPLPPAKDCRDSNVIVLRPTTAVRPRVSAPITTTETRKSAFTVNPEPRKMPMRESKQRVARMYSPEPTLTDSMDCSLEAKSQKNAIQARLNRQKKKAYVSGLEKQVADLSKENKELVATSSKLRKNVDSLEQELCYLRSVLQNDSALASMLGNMGDGLSLSLTSSFRNDRKRGAPDADHCYGQSTKRQRSSDSAKAAMSGGVCLHVEQSKVSLEFCSKCARMAKEREP